MKGNFITIPRKKINTLNIYCVFKLEYTAKNDKLVASIHDFKQYTFLHFKKKLIIWFVNATLLFFSLKIT